MSYRAIKVENTIAELAVAFSAAFTLDPTLVRPLKLCIKDDLHARSAISRRRITAALRSYCTSVHYLKASTEGALRIGLAGEPVGAVTAAEAQYATDRLLALTKVAAAATKVASESRGGQAREGTDTEKPRVAAAVPKGGEISKRPVATEPATPGRKRLSLSDLKRAAAARKAIR
jgi:sRNA-binding protein